MGGHEYEQILREQRDEVVLLTLNRPDKLNAWTPQMSAELTDAIEAADADTSVGAVVVTGAGRGFCAGADISAVFNAQIEGDSSASAPARPARARDWIELIRSTKPIVAAVNGPSIGVGLTMILPFDRIVVAESAKLSVRFVKMGLVPELASSRTATPTRWPPAWTGSARTGRLWRRTRGNWRQTNSISLAFARHMTVCTTTSHRRPLRAGGRLPDGSSVAARARPSGRGLR